jgi:hypothetical protein
VTNIKVLILAKDPTPTLITARYFSGQGILIHLTLLRVIKVKKMVFKRDIEDMTNTCIQNFG